MPRITKFIFNIIRNDDLIDMNYWLKDDDIQDRHNLIFIAVLIIVEMVLVDVVYLHFHSMNHLDCIINNFRDYL